MVEGEEEMARFGAMRASVAAVAVGGGGLVASGVAVTVDVTYVGM